MFNLVRTLIFICLTLLCLCESAFRRKFHGNRLESVRKNNRRDANEDSPLYPFLYPLKQKGQSCWMSMDVDKHFLNMGRIEEKYAAARQKFRMDIEKDNYEFNEHVLEAIVKSRGIVNKGLDAYNIPAGLNLGGYSILRMTESLLFFHRMKLRNDTHFRIEKLTTELHLMRVTGYLSLNDLHLVGSYERILTDPANASKLYYSPTYGQAEILLRDVKYSFEGRLRFLVDSPYIVLMFSVLDYQDSLMTYQNNATHIAEPIRLPRASIQEILDRIAADLNEWMRDYLNEHLMFYSVGRFVTDEIRQFHHALIIEFNRHMEQSIQTMKARIHELNATAVELPDFDVFSVNGVELKMTDGVLRGLDSLYRRSVASGGVEGPIRKLDAVIGFSNLKATYKYTAYLPTGVPPLTGMLVLTADELTSTMGMDMVVNPESVDLEFAYFNQVMPESLTVEGPANRNIANFKHLLEHHIISLVSNALNYNIENLESLGRCFSKFHPYIEPEDRAPE